MVVLVASLIIPAFVGVVFVFSESKESPLQGGIQSAQNDIVAKEKVVSEVVPGNVVEIVYGYSEDGRPIEGYEIGNGDNCLLFFSGIHGNERGTKILLNTFVQEVEKNLEIIHPSNKLLVIPLLNPDGFYDREDKYNSNGINLNRNFYSEYWASYSSDDPTWYGGPEPFSEAESRVMKDVVEGCNTKLMVAYHSQGYLVSPEHDTESEELAVWYAEKTGYDYFDDWDFHGTATGWFTETTGYPSITVELTDHTTSDWQINREALFEIVSKEYDF